MAQTSITASRIIASRIIASSTNRSNDNPRTVGDNPDANNGLAKICSFYQKHEKLIDLALTAFGFGIGAGLTLVASRPIAKWCMKAGCKALLKHQFAKLVPGSVIPGNTTGKGNKHKNSSTDTQKYLVSKNKPNPQDQSQLSQYNPRTNPGTNPRPPSTATAQKNSQSPSSPTSSHNNKTLVVSPVPLFTAPQLKSASLNNNSSINQPPRPYENDERLFQLSQNNAVPFNRINRNKPLTHNFQNWLYSLNQHTASA